MFLRQWLSALALLSAALSDSAADFYVKSLPGLEDEPPVKMHAGYYISVLYSRSRVRNILVDEASNGHLFFWHIQNQYIADIQRTVRDFGEASGADRQVIWLNGGPGCSSEDGVMMEVGPFRTDDGEHLQYNNGSWSQFANLLFVDQPIGTGYSYADSDKYLSDLQPMAEQFGKLLDEFMTTFPEYSHDELYIAGESYAGTYIPYIANQIVNKNKKVPADKRLNLKGILIGNGWIDPQSQYGSYLSFASSSNLLKGDVDALREVQAASEDCGNALESDGVRISVSRCERVLDVILEHTKYREAGKEQCVNMYDIRLEDEFPSCGMQWPPALQSVTNYLRKPEVAQALNVKADKQAGWTECSGAVTNRFTASNSQPAINLIPDLLKEIKVWFYSGDQDLICNHIGTEAMIDNLAWAGGQGFHNAKGSYANRRDWVVNDQEAGFFQSRDNLTYVLVQGASHMVPWDKPLESRDMLNRFLDIDYDLSDDGTSSTVDAGDGTDESEPAGQDQQTQEDEIKQATWRAYYRVGSFTLAIVILLCIALAYFIFKQRRAAARGYRHVPFKFSRSNSFEEGELDDLMVPAHDRTTVFDATRDPVRASEDSVRSR